MRLAALIGVLLFMASSPTTAQGQTARDPTEGGNLRVPRGAPLAAQQAERDDGLGISTAALIGGLAGAYTGAVLGAVITLDCDRACPIFGLVGGAVGALVGVALLADGGDAGAIPRGDSRRAPVLRYSVAF